MSMRSTIVVLVLLVSSGCTLVPVPIRQPTLHNPFPQLSRVAVAPFFNLSAEPTLDGRQVAGAYFAELQAVPGFEVVPVGVVEMAMREHKIVLSGPQDARKLAQLLQVDALIIGAITDYSPYYPPRCALQVEWYAANPGFHPIPPGYGLPWGTHEEQDIPGPLIFEAEFALAKEQLRTQTPPESPSQASAPSAAAAPTPPAEGTTPPFWPDPRGFVPPPPRTQPPTCWPSEAPVLRHTRVYRGNDAAFTAALENYYVSRNEARFDGWQGYLQRSDDFMKFCCHMHIWEMLGARGGAGKSRVVWQWPTIR